MDPQTTGGEQSSRERRDRSRSRGSSSRRRRRGRSRSRSRSHDRRRRRSRDRSRSRRERRRDDDEWAALAAEIQAIAAGATVEKIDGDQTTKAVFFFPHPTLARCDREVVFVCVEGEWRAEG